MKVQVASDLHLEFFEQRFPDFRAVVPTDADVLVLAGDIHRNAQAAVAFRDWPCPVFLIHGNHELYGADAAEMDAQLRACSQGSVTFLEQGEAIIGGVRFLGTCLWTDYALTGNPVESMLACGRILMDHKAIRVGDGMFLPEHALQRHRAARAWLEAKLAEPFAGKTVVVTHHGPHVGSIHAQYASDAMNPGFISDLTHLMGPAALWVHGHVHNSFDYAVAGTRVVANPRGYAFNLKKVDTIEAIRWENPHFDPGFVVEL
ncbi:MAG: metallophosphoesterase [Burkholderiales bacterium]|nr:metallophosphoesterase [Burkholderiales bacterium]